MQFKYFNNSRFACWRRFSRYSGNKTLCEFQLYSGPLGFRTCLAGVFAVPCIRRNQLRKRGKRKTHHNDGNELVGMFELLEMLELLDRSARLIRALFVEAFKTFFR